MLILKTILNLFLNIIFIQVLKIRFDMTTFIFISFDRKQLMT